MKLISKIILTCLAALPMAASAQVDFSVIGKVDKLSPNAKVYLHYLSGQEYTMDSTAIENGTFRFHGSTPEPSRATVLLMHQGEDIFQAQDHDVVEVYLTKGTISITTADSLQRAEVSGGKLNDEFMDYKKGLAPVQVKVNALRGRHMDASEEQRHDPDFIAELQAEIEQIQQEQRDFDFRYITDNVNSLVSLDVLSMYLESEPINEIIKPLYDQLGSSVRNSSRGQQLGTYILSAGATSIGSLAPDFTLPDTAGNDFSLSSLKGQYVLIDFWASWCAPCRHENPNLVAAYEQFKDKQFTILGVSLDRPGQGEAWMKAIHDDKLQGWPNVSDLKFWQSEAAKLYHITSIPQNFLLDPEGVIIAKNLRGEELHQVLGEILSD